MPEENTEIRLKFFKSKVEPLNLLNRFEKFSCWKRLILALSLLKTAARRKISKIDASSNLSNIDLQRDIERIILRQVQRHVYPEEYRVIFDSKQIPKSNSLVSLRPYMDKVQIIRIGGRLNQVCLPIEETTPIILPRKSWIALLVARHFHEKVKHQGRLWTESAIRSGGYWIVGAKQLVSPLIHSCIKCRKLRGPTFQQLMADLPEDRLIPGPPFTFVGSDAFGPYSVVTRKTRGKAARSERWGVMFTCLTTLFRCHSCLKVDAVNVEDEPLASFIQVDGVKWLFNSPHCLHTGGVWERMLGLTRNILNGILLDCKSKNLTHKVLLTFMAEASAIINSRPVAAKSRDPSDPLILSPLAMLIQKVKSQPIVCQDVSIKDIYTVHWKQVQALSDIFWKKWRDGYLQHLQRRRKWFVDQPNIKDGHVVLVKDESQSRSEW